MSGAPRFDVAPRFGTVPLIGWRVWHVDGGDLLSWNDSEPWPYRDELAAVCIATAAHPSGTPTPAVGCTCGVHAYRTSRLALKHAGPADALKNVALGRVKLWGRVIEHDEGWRAQYAYPELVYVHDALERELVELNYGCETRLVPREPAPALPPASTAAAPAAAGALSQLQPRGARMPQPGPLLRRFSLGPAAGAGGRHYWRLPPHGYLRAIEITLPELLPNMDAASSYTIDLELREPNGAPIGGYVVHAIVQDVVWPP